VVALFVVEGGCISACDSLELEREKGRGRVEAGGAQLGEAVSLVLCPSLTCTKSMEVTIMMKWSLSTTSFDVRLLFLCSLETLQRSSSLSYLFGPVS